MGVRDMGALVRVLIIYEVCLFDFLSYNTVLRIVFD